MAHCFHLRLVQALVLAAPLLTHIAKASEGGGTDYPNGTDNFTAGAMPPPGTYGMLFGTHYRAKRVNDANGDNFNVPGFNVEANVLALRSIWVTETKLLGGDLSWHAVVPIVDLKVSAAGRSQHKTGVGDITAGPGLGSHDSPNLHTVAALDVYLPTGAYDRADLANIGRNYWAFEPLYIVSYVEPMGFNGVVKAGWIFNRRNKDTDYTSGQESTSTTPSAMGSATALPPASAATGGSK